MASDPAGQPPPDDGADSQVPPPQGHVGRVPYDFRRPSAARTAARWWNPADLRLFTPKAFGAGWDLNFYWFLHPLAYLRGRRARR